MYAKVKVWKLAFWVGGNQLLYGPRLLPARNQRRKNNCCEMRENKSKKKQATTDTVLNQNQKLKRLPYLLDLVCCLLCRHV